jgi:hypothetical protein
MPLFVLEPPVQYVHHYHGPVIERILPLSEARKACAGKGVHAYAYAYAYAYACAWTSNGACHLVIPSNGPVRNRGAYRRHELAHCNGWDHAIVSRGDGRPIDW